MSGAAVTMRRPELLAPGGSMEGIRACVNAGADAVYAGGRLFGARAFADNPETEGLLEAIDYCHLHGVKLYLTVNTLLKEHELTQMLPEYLAPIYEHGVDAVLVQDFGVFHFLKEHFPDLPLHASTQMTVTGPDGVKLLEGMGAQRVVLSRELSLEEIRSVHASCGVELETFVHGALCYCYSGKCLMSSLIGGRSGNRGRCAQPCRLPWDLCENAADARSKRYVNPSAQQYLLSPKDLCTLRLIPDLVDAGITSFKIEGRMKSPEYAAGVTAMYRGYIDLYLEKGREGFHVEEDDEALLKELFSRGAFSEGYYGTRNGREMITLEEKPPQTGDMLRHLQESAEHIREMYVDVRKAIPLTARVTIRAGQPALMEVSDRHGHSARVEGFLPSPALSRPADRQAVLKQVGKTGNTDFTFESVDVELQEGLFVQVRDLNELRRRALDAVTREILRAGRRKLNTAKTVQEAGGQQEEETQAAGQPEGAAQAGVCARAEEQPKEGAQATGQPEEAQAGVCARAEEQPVEEARADGQQEEETQAAGKPEGYVQGLYMGGYARIVHPSVTASVCTQDQLEAVLQEKKVGGVYLDSHLMTAENVSRVWDSGRKIYLMLPDIWRIDTARIIKEKVRQEFGSFSPQIKASLDGVLVKCYDQLHALKEANLLNDGDGFEVIADAGLYTWNDAARRQLFELGVTMDTLPYECSSHELAGRGCAGSECVVYGYQTLMVSAQCLAKTTQGCGKQSRVRYLKDRKGVLFAVKNDCELCLNTIYNSVPLELVSLSGQLKRLGVSGQRYLFTTESREQTRRILRGSLPDKVTRGHFRKGVE